MGGHWRQVSRQYFDLTKPRVVALIVFTAAIGMFLAVPGLPPLRESVLGFLGIWLAASSAAAINQLLDARIDAKMTRTSWRPIVAGQITPARALLFRSEEHTSELQSLMRISYAVFCLTTK